MPVRTLTRPACLPVSVEEFRRHLWNVFDGHDSDELFLALIKAATEEAAGEGGEELRLGAGVTARPRSDGVYRRVR